MYSRAWMKFFLFLLLIILIGIYTFWNDLSRECIKYGGMNPYTYEVALRKTPNISSQLASNLKAKSFSELKENKAKWVYYYTLKNNSYVRKKDFILGYVQVCNSYVIEEKLFLTYIKDIYRLLPFMIFIFGIWFVILVLLNKFKRKVKITKQTKQKKEEKKVDIDLSKNDLNFTCLDCKRISVNNKFCIYCGKKVYTEEESFNANKYITVANSKDGLLVALLTKVAKANGKISLNEAQYMSVLFDKICQNSSFQDLRNILKDIHKKEKDKQNNVEETCRKLLQLNISTSDKKSIISILVELATLDGIYRDEENILTKIVHLLDIEYTEYKKIVEYYSPKQKNNNYSSENKKELTTEKSYKILNCTDHDDLNTIKRSKNKLLREYHPDRQGREISESMKRIAEEKTQEINAAYAKIKKVKNY